jgi:probable addiction module antidote protein
MSEFGSLRERIALSPIPGKAEKSLRAAFTTNDLRRICSVVDVAVHRYGISDFARDTGVDRTTLYRAFRLEKGPQLDTMVRVLRVLRFRLTVEIRDQSDFQATNRLSRHALQLDAKASARVLNAAFKSCDLDLVIEAFAETLKSQKNVSEFARKTTRSREALYRSFALPRVPRFSTVLSFLNALGLQFGIERLPSKSQN